MFPERSATSRACIRTPIHDESSPPAKGSLSHLLFFFGSIGVIAISNPSFFFKTSVVMFPSSSDGLEKHEAKNTSRNMFLIEPGGLGVLMLEAQVR